MIKLKLKIIKLCSDEESRMQGLMKFRRINDSECAFFIFPYEKAHPFWNKDVDYDLSLAYVNSRFKIICFSELDAMSEQAVYPSSREVKYVIEVNRGIFDRADVREGDVVDFDPHENMLVIRDEDQIRSMFDYLRSV